MALTNEKSNLSGNEIIKKAGELAVEYKRKGFHCSESVIRAVPEALEIALPADVVKAGCGFFGGGGGTGGRCGIIEVGIMLISFLYARIHPLQSDENLKVIIPKLIGEFENTFGSIQCCDIKKNAVEKFGEEYGCTETYIKGAEIVTRILLEAD